MVERDGLTVLMVTHDRELAARFTDRIVMMKDGRIVQETGDRIQETGDKRQETGDRRQKPEE
jgi:ABC-type cobalamin/Fe3+-siderophores transport system ATPase subunit